MLQKVAVVAIGGIIAGVAAIFLDAIVSMKEIPNGATTNGVIGQLAVIINALKLMKKRVHDLVPNFK